MSSRRTLLAALAAAPLMLAFAAQPAPAIEAGKAGAFIQKLGDEAIGRLGKAKLDKQEREQELRRLLNEAFAIKGIGRFVLGRYWRRADAAQRERYLQAFEDLIVTTYAARFEAYDGQTFTVAGERPDGKNGRLVESQISPKEGPPIKLQWRIRQGGDSLKIVDVLVEGVSMAITQRSEFAAVIQQKGGSVDGLIQELESKVGKLRR